MQFLATITKPRMTAFHFYVDDDNGLYCAVNNDIPRNKMEYYPKEKWVVLSDFMKHGAGIKNNHGKNVKISGVKILGLRIDDYILNKIFWNNHFNINSNIYTYQNYLDYLDLIRNKRGYLVRVCENNSSCGTAIIVSTIKGARIKSKSLFNEVKKNLDRKPRNSKPLIYQLSDKHYFIELRTSKRFVCYKCITGRYYRNSYLYDLDHYGWSKLESRNDSSTA